MFFAYTASNEEFLITSGWEISTSNPMVDA